MSLLSYKDQVVYKYKGLSVLKINLFMSRIKSNPNMKNIKNAHQLCCEMYEADETE